MTEWLTAIGIIAADHCLYISQDVDQTDQVDCDESVITFW